MRNYATEEEFIQGQLGQDRTECVEALLNSSECHVHPDWSDVQNLTMDSPEDVAAWRESADLVHPETEALYDALTEDSERLEFAINCGFEPAQKEVHAWIQIGDELAEMFHIMCGIVTVECMGATYWGNTEEGVSGRDCEQIKLAAELWIKRCRLQRELDGIEREIICQCPLIESMLENESSDSCYGWDSVENLEDNRSVTTIDYLESGQSGFDEESEEWEDFLKAKEDDDDDDLLEIAEEYGFEPQQHEIFYWLRVECAFYMDLKRWGLPVLSEGQSYWWGRTTYGQPIRQDGEIIQIAEERIAKRAETCKKST